MLKVAKKYGASLAAIRLSASLRAKLSAWYHLKTKPRPLTNKPSKCPLKKHKIETVADQVEVSARLRDHSRAIPHMAIPRCGCEDCIIDRINSCLDPGKCPAEALTRIHDIVPRLNPLNPGDPHDNLSLTHLRKTQNARAKKDDKEIIFNPSITCKDGPHRRND
ncbi:hypothetical protein EDB87DRAFT_1553419 [Lactarius vividus]|nr:hypothetical protein EDB87DRAFT_1553419 [Lactarius vividus]